MLFAVSGKELEKRSGRQCPTLYDFEEEEGISMTESAAKRDIETRTFPSLEENKKAFAQDSDGKYRSSGGFTEVC